MAKVVDCRVNIDMNPFEVLSDSDLLIMQMFGEHNLFNPHTCLFCDPQLAYLIECSHCHTGS